MEDSNSSGALKAGFIEAGNMGSMLLRGLLRSGSLPVTNIWVANRSAGKLEDLAAEFPGLNCADAAGTAQETGILFLCVKPADTKDVLAAIDRYLRADHICVLLTNVFTFRELESRIPCRVAKLIPTVTQQINRGVALLAYGSRIKTKDSTRLERLLRPTGNLLVVSEDHLRLFADVASCGPALLATCLEELHDYISARFPDISTSDLRLAAIETLSATAELLRSGVDPKEMIRQVAVPGGMTQAGMKVLRQSLPALLTSVFESIQKTEQRKRESLRLD